MPPQVVVSWKLLFGIAQLYGELLMSKQNPLTPLERARVRGDSPDMLREELLTLQYLAKMPLPGLWPAQQVRQRAFLRGITAVYRSSRDPCLP